MKALDVSESGEIHFVLVQLELHTHKYSVPQELKHHFNMKVYLSGI